MANEDLEVVAQVPKKDRFVKVLLLIIIGILVIAMCIGGTLFLSGFFDSKSVTVDEYGNITVQQSNNNKLEKNARDDLKPSDSFTKNQSKGEKFDQLYNEMERVFTVNLTGSHQFFQFTVGFMTHYDERVVDNVYKHELAIRSDIIMEASTYSKELLMTVSDKKKLAEVIKSSMNQVLISYEGFGGVEEVFFTEFVIQ